MESIEPHIAYEVGAKSPVLPRTHEQRDTRTAPLPVEDSKSLANRWLEHSQHVKEIQPILASMARLKLQLKFSINEFVAHLGIDTMTPARAAVVLEAYAFWSGRACGMMPLRAMVAPMLSGKPAKDLAQHLHQISDTTTLQLYLDECVYHFYTHPEAKQWFHTLVDVDRSLMAAFTPSHDAIKCSMLYQTYLLMTMDSIKMPYLSIDAKFALVMDEWDAWHAHAPDDRVPLDQWTQIRAKLISRDYTLDRSIQAAFQAVAFWFCEFNDHAPQDRSLFRHVVEEHSQHGKIQQPRLVLMLVSQACQWQNDTDRTSTCLFQIVDQARALFAEDRVLQSTDLFAMLLCMMQITLRHFSSLLTYTQWFETTFLNANTTQLQTKYQVRAWLQQLRLMLPHESMDVLQIHGKLLHDRSTDEAYRSYVSEARSQLLKMGMDANFRQAPMLGKPILSARTLGSDVRNSSSYTTLAGSSRSSSSSHTSSTVSSSGTSSICSTMAPGCDPATFEHLMQQFEANGTIPVSITENAIFQAKWFKESFLPALIAWTPAQNSHSQLRHKLILALRAKKRVPLDIYANYMKKHSA